jgi:hypothetical protein
MQGSQLGWLPAGREAGEHMMAVIRNVGTYTLASS